MPRFDGQICQTSLIWTGKETETDLSLAGKHWAFARLEKTTMAVVLCFAGWCQCMYSRLRNLNLSDARFFNSFLLPPSLSVAELLVSLMSATPAQIQVYASLPRTLTPSGSSSSGSNLHPGN